MKILVAMLSYDGKIDVDVALNMVNEKAVSLMLGDDLVFEVLRGSSHLASARNQMAKAFMESDCDRLVFLDSDLLWEAGSISKIARFPQEFVGGCYRYKSAKEGYPVTWLDDPDGKGLFSNENGLIEVASVPTGFLSLSRTVFAKMVLNDPNRIYFHQGHELFAYFEMPYDQKQLWQEDAHFCRSWRELGGKVFLDPMLKFSHLNFAPIAYTGCIGEFLGGMRPIPDDLQPIEKGI